MTKTKELTPNRLAVRKYFAQIWKERRFALPALVLPALGNVFVVYLPPLVVATMLERFNNTAPGMHDLLPYLLTFGGIWLAGEVIWRIAFTFLVETEARVMRNLYSDALEELTKKDIHFFHNDFAGSLTKKAIGYGRNFEGFFDTLTFNVLANTLPILFAAVILWRYSPWLVIVLLILVTLVILIVLPFIRKRRKLVHLREQASNVMAGHIADTIGNMDAVQAFAHEEHELKRHQENVKDYAGKARASWHYQTLRIDSVISPIYVMINVTGLAVAIMLAKDGATMAAIFITFNYYAQITRVLWEFSRIYRNIENAITEGAQFTELLLVPNIVNEVEHPTKLKITRGEVEFKDVTFTYHDNDQDPLFSNLDLHIPAGEKLALVGHSGGGKTTITKLLLRFADIDSGELLIDGQSVKEGRLSDLRNAIAYVPQEPIMFHRTIRENIRYGQLDASDEEVITAAKKANAHEFIEQLPHGYDTLVGERGVKLSGGQRQRVAIARAVIKNAPILVLDEATSALDSESEKLIQAALWDLMKDRTAIVIAHRLSTIQKMDRIVVLDKGAIAEEGKHQELLKQKGIYASLWTHQSGGFLED